MQLICKKLLLLLFSTKCIYIVITISLLIEPYVYITGFLVIYQETILNLCLSFLAVTLISIPVLQSNKAVFAVLICVVAIDLELLGLIRLWGLSLNSLTMIALVMAIGLVVDYLAHIVHYFMIHSGSSGDVRVRMAKALAEVGGAVAVGGLTTFIGVLPLFFASSWVYRVFFKLFLSIVVLGILHGFVIAPLLVVLLFSCEKENSKTNGVKVQPGGRLPVKSFEEDGSESVCL